MRSGFALLVLAVAIAGCGRTRENAHDVGAPSAGAAAVVNETGEGGASDDSCPARVVTTVSDEFCLPYEVLAASCFAPPSQRRHYQPLAAWATDPFLSETLSGGRRSFYSAGYFREAGEGWEASPYCMPKGGPFALLALDDESSVTASSVSRPATTWQVSINGAPFLDGLAMQPGRVVISGATLILDADFYVRDGDAWSPIAHALPWALSKMIGLGADRFARFVDATGTMELTRRVGTDWVPFGSVPGTDDASMTADGAMPARIAINSHNGASVYQQDADAWVPEKSFAPAKVASLGSDQAGAPTLVIADESAVHIFSLPNAWQEVDAIPLANAQALASGGVVIVASTDPKYLEGLPDLSPGRRPASLVIVYAPVE
jgi:hypothetical protein